MLNKSRLIKTSILYLTLIICSFFIGMKWCIVEKTITKPEGSFKLDAESRKLVGSWLVKGENWGFTLYDDGTASPINSATLIYQRWTIKNDEICLTARSIGNHTQSVSTDCNNYIISGSGNKTRLSIGDGDYKVTYQVSL